MRMPRGYACTQCGSDSVLSGRQLVAPSSESVGGGAAWWVGEKATRTLGVRVARWGQRSTRPKTSTNYQKHPTTGEKEDKLCTHMAKEPEK